MRVCDSREKLLQLPGGPKVILASLPSLTAGLSRQLFVDWAPNPANLIVFTSDQMVRSSPSHWVLTCAATTQYLTANKQKQEICPLSEALAL